VEEIYPAWQRRTNRTGDTIFQRTVGDYRCLVFPEGECWVAQVMGPPYCYPDYGLREARLADATAARAWADAETTAIRAARRPPLPPSRLN
jgi:hypothetical protein